MLYLFAFEFRKPVPTNQAKPCNTIFQSIDFGTSCYKNQSDPHHPQWPSQLIGFVIWKKSSFNSCYIIFFLLSFFLSVVSLCVNVCLLLLLVILLVDTRLCRNYWTGKCLLLLKLSTLGMSVWVYSWPCSEWWHGWVHILNYKRLCMCLSVT